MQNRDTRDIAEWLYREHQARRSFVTHPALRGGALALAYDVQDALVDLRLKATAQKIIGYKIGLTTPRMQQMCGLDHPIAGVILSGGARASGVAIDAAPFVRLGLECEVAVRLKTPLDGALGALSIADVSARVGEIAAAFEVIEDRAADYKTLDMPSLIADNSWNAGMVLGPSRALVDLSDLKGTLSINGAEADAGSTLDVLGHPLNSVAWLAAHLAQRGKRIEAGEWVMTGSIVPTRFPACGDAYSFAIVGLPPVEATVK